MLNRFSAVNDVKKTIQERVYAIQHHKTTNKGQLPIAISYFFVPLQQSTNLMKSRYEHQKV